VDGRTDGQSESDCWNQARSVSDYQVRELQSRILRVPPQWLIACVGRKWSHTDWRPFFCLASLQQLLRVSYEPVNASYFYFSFLLSSVILLAPVNHTVRFSDPDTIFSCNVSGESLAWYIDGEFYRPHDTALIQRGIQVERVSSPSGEVHETLTVRVSPQNNFTSIQCRGIVFGENLTWSEPVYLIIAGK